LVHRDDRTGAFPGAEGSVPIPKGTATLDDATERATLLHELDALGMTPAEAGVFLRAWSDELFGAAPRGPARDVGRATSAGAVARPHDTLLYWLPPGVVETIAPLTIRPAPRATHRAWLVRVDLGAR
jgi:hypothetical protein